MENRHIAAPPRRHRLILIALLLCGLGLIVAIAADKRPQTEWRLADGSFIDPNGYHGR